MSEEAPRKSHATGWIIGVVLALVLYMGSAYPVCLSFFRSKGSWLPHSWEKPVQSFYEPALWMWNKPPLEKFKKTWVAFWIGIMDVRHPKI